MEGWRQVLPRASAELVFLFPSSGGAGLVQVVDLLDLASIKHVFRLLTNPDPTVRSVSPRKTFKHLVAAGTRKETSLCPASTETLLKVST